MGGVLTEKKANKYDGPYRVRLMGSDRYTIVPLKGVRSYRKVSAIVAPDSLRRYVSSARGEIGTNVDVDTSGDVKDDYE